MSLWILLEGDEDVSETKEKREGVFVGNWADPLDDGRWIELKRSLSCSAVARFRGPRNFLAVETGALFGVGSWVPALTYQGLGKAGQ
jgi:hypothetical protein